MIGIRRLGHTCLCGGSESGLNAYVMNMAQGPGLTIRCNGARERENLNFHSKETGTRKRNYRGCSHFFCKILSYTTFDISGQRESETRKSTPSEQREQKGAAHHV